MTGIGFVQGGLCFVFHGVHRGACIIPSQLFAIAVPQIGRMGGECLTVEGTDAHQCMHSVLFRHWQKGIISKRVLVGAAGLNPPRGKPRGIFTVRLLSF